jgi:copper chaperone CopZ
MPLCPCLPRLIPALACLFAALLSSVTLAQYDLDIPTASASPKPALMDFGFENVPDGPLPGAWRSTSPRIKPVDGQPTAPRDPAKWAIETLDGAKRVVCRPATPAADFNQLVLDQPVGPDVEVTVRMTPLSGTTDQGGGIMFRIVDERNFYLMRYNPLKKDLRLYRVVDGAGEKLAAAENVEHIPGTTHSLTVRARGNALTGWMDGKELVAASDDRYTKAGSFGLWTKSDAATAFGNLRISDRSQGGPDLVAAASNQIIITVEGMSCAMCEGTVANTLKKLKGVKSAAASHEDKTCTIELEPGSSLTAEQLVKALAATKYKASIKK